MRNLLRRFLSLGICSPTPPGITPDRSANDGLFALMHNANLQSLELNTVTTAGTSSTLTALQSRCGVLVLAAGASGGFSINLASTSSIIDSLGPTLVTDGRFCKLIAIKNDAVGQTGTLTAGDASTTVTGTATIATNTTRLFLLQVTAASTITFTNLGSLAL